jgi:uncharacterized protein with ParB-like and HNH nuclease domain
MSYESKTIEQIVDDIEHGKAFLPAIQRKFVWPKWKIERLFDSIMRNYPIGSFLFWELKSDKAEDYVFYNFLKSYNEQNPYNELKDSSFRHSEIIGVLDGQQRLSSLFIGLMGTYAEKVKYLKRKSEYAYPITKLYINLLSLPYIAEKDSKQVIGISSDKNFEFCFLTPEQAEVTEITNSDGTIQYYYWQKVSELLKGSKHLDIYAIYESIIKDKPERFLAELSSNRNFIISFLINFYSRIKNEKLINYFKVNNDDLEAVLEIFIRVNSGGTILSKTDLLFSTIVANWDDGREQIEAFLKLINAKGDGFWFSNDFLMRACLVLSDLPVLFKVNSFKSENVALIKSNWEGIKSSITKTIDLLVDIGFNGTNLTSQNSIIIIAYYFFKGGSEHPDNKENIRRYLLHALLMKIYGGQGDQIISTLRNSFLNEELLKNKIYKLKDKDFPFDELLKLKLPGNKSLKITIEDLEDFMTYKKGAESFFVLSLLYPSLRYNERKFHQDHIHPDTRFSPNKLKALGIPEDKWQLWNDLKDTVPNLQIMDAIQNTSKNDTPFDEWLSHKYSGNDAGKARFLEENHIINNTDLSFENFDQFYQLRKEILLSKLKEVLSINTD